MGFLRTGFWAAVRSHITRQPKIVRNAKPGRAATTVLHVSDLHFGFRFDNVLWQDVIRRARAIRPDLIVVTGDLVNTPYHGDIDRSVERLIQLRDSLRVETEKPHLELVAIPGNHDTRISGLFPVTWLLPTSLAAVLLAQLCRYFQDRHHPWLIYVTFALAGVAVLGLMLRLATTSSLWRGRRGEIFIDKPLVVDGFNVGVIPFDSASDGMSFAAGKVRRGALSNFRDAAEKLEKDAQPQGVFWLAAVHHHPVPLPYDSGSEPMMIMVNAGKFVHELASYGVPLILHGHKHHHHFSKLSFRTPYSPESEIAILSASTPSEKDGAGAFRHGFNVIHVDSEHNAKVSVYSAQPTGETFALKETFMVSSAQQVARRRYEQYLSSTGVQCRRLLFRTSIQPFGDAEVRREFVAFQSLHGPLSSVPGIVRLNCDEGHVGAVKVNVGMQSGPLIGVREKKRTTEDIQCELVFDGSLLAPNTPIDFTVEMMATNAFALNAEQHRELYPTDASTVEQMVYTVPDGMAITELELQLVFPDELCKPRQVHLSRSRPLEPSVWLPGLEAVESGVDGKTFSVRVAHPAPNGRYRLTWQVPEDSARPTPEVQRAASDVQNEAPEEVKAESSLDEEARARLAAGQVRAAMEELNHLSDESRARISGLLPALVETLVPHLHTEGERSPTDIAVFSYDKSRQRLVCVASSYDAKDPRRGWEYAYGRGLPGRALKQQTIVAFDRYNISQFGPSYYLRGDGTVAEKDSDIPEGSAVAIPLIVAGKAYGVVQVSVDGPGGHMEKVFVPNQALKDAQDFTSAIILEALRGAILPNTEEDEK